MNDSKKSPIEILFTILVWQNICTIKDLHCIKKFLDTGVQPLDIAPQIISLNNSLWGPEIIIKVSNDLLFEKLREYYFLNAENPPIEFAEERIMRILVNRTNQSVVLEINDNKIYYDEYYHYELIYSSLFWLDHLIVLQNHTTKNYKRKYDNGSYSNYTNQFCIIINESYVELIDNNSTFNIPEQDIFNKKEKLILLSKYNQGVVLNILSEMNNWQFQSLLSNSFDKTKMVQLLTTTTFEELIVSNYGGEFYFNRMEYLPKYLIIEMIDLAGNNFDDFRFIYIWLIQNFGNNKIGMKFILESISNLLMVFYEDKFGHKFSASQKLILNQYLQIVNGNPNIRFKSFKRISEQVDKYFDFLSKEELPNFEIDDDRNLLSSSGSYHFNFIRTNKLLAKESFNMSHCVRTYFRDMIDLKKYIYHLDVKGGDTKGYTVALKLKDSKFNLSECKGYKNSNSPEHVIKEVKRQVNSINEMLEGSKLIL